jgi:hypothetical protein
MVKSSLNSVVRIIADGKVGTVIGYENNGRRIVWVQGQNGGFKQYYWDSELTVLSDS